MESTQPQRAHGRRNRARLLSLRGGMVLALLWVAMATVGVSRVFATSLFVSSYHNGNVMEYDATTGTFVRVFASGVSNPLGLVFGPNGNLFVASYSNFLVQEYNGTTGAFVRTFVPSGSGGLVYPDGLVFGPNGNLFVTCTIASAFCGGVLEYNGTTGAFVRNFVRYSTGGSSIEGLGAPRGVVFGPNGNLFVTESHSNCQAIYNVVNGGLINGVQEYNGTTGTFVRAFVPACSGGLNSPWGLVFGPNGNLFVTSSATLIVFEYDGTTGAFVRTFVPFGSGGGLTFKTTTTTAITLIDPVPHLLSGPRITNALTAAQGLIYLADLTKGRVVKGVATDGVAQVVLRISAKSVGEQFALTVRADQCAALSSNACVDEYGLLFDPANPPANIFTNTQGQSLLVTAVSTDKGPMAFAAYRAPVDFVRSGIQIPPDTNEGQRSAFISVNSIQNGVQSDLEIKLVRPPVSLIHGVWSDSSTWLNFSPLIILDNLHGGFSFDPRFFIRFFDYKSTNGDGVLSNAQIALGRVKAIIEEFKRNKNMAAVQTDVVAHSMGGLITRALVKTESYLMGLNYRKGLVHKLITLDTPHLGSDLATNLYASNGLCKAAWGYFERKVGDAVRDFQPGSDALQFLRQPELGLPAHLIAGIASSTQEEVAYGAIGTLASIGINDACPSLLPAGGFKSLFPLTGESDTIVSLVSQKGTFDSRTQQFVFLGYNGGSVPFHEHKFFVHSVDIDLFVVGPDILSRNVDGKNVVGITTAIPDRVIELLNQSVLGNAYAPMLP